MQNYRVGEEVEVLYPVLNWWKWIPAVVTVPKARYIECDVDRNGVIKRIDFTPDKIRHINQFQVMGDK